MTTCPYPPKQHAAMLVEYYGSVKEAIAAVKFTKPLGKRNANDDAHNRAVLRELEGLVLMSTITSGTPLK